MTLNTSCQEENISLQLIKTSILNEESRRKDKGVMSQSESNMAKYTRRGLDIEVHRGGTNPKTGPSREVSSHVSIVESFDTFRRIVETLNRTKVPQRMLNPECFMRKRAHQQLLQVKRRFCSFVSKEAQILQVKSVPG